jgi:protein arginine kinase activator
MKCQLCAEREASIHYVEIVEGKKTSQWICAECAAEEGITPTEVTKLAHGSLGSMLGDMLSEATGEPTESEAQAGLVCDVCGYQYEQLQQKGRLGCPACYATFQPKLLSLLRRYHGDTRHVGRVPRSRGPRAALRREIARFKLQLDQAVQQEDYEEAARLRDEIRAAKGQIELIEREQRESGRDPDDPDPGGAADGPSDEA